MKFEDVKSWCKKHKKGLIATGVGAVGAVGIFLGYQAGKTNVNYTFNYGPDTPSDVTTALNFNKLASAGESIDIPKDLTNSVSHLWSENGMQKAIIQQVEPEELGKICDKLIDVGIANQQNVYSGNVTAVVEFIPD